MSDDTLLPCPFCGSVNIAEEGRFTGVDWTPECLDCGASTESREAWNTREVDSALELCGKALRTALAELEELALNTRWIPVSERLPEPMQMVLVYEVGFARTDKHHQSEGFDGTVARQPGVRFGYICSTGFRAEGVNGRCLITHWMPLPSQPTED